MSRVLVAALAAYLAFVVVGSFAHNMPRWCADPEGHGNWMVQPWCAK